MGTNLERRDSRWSNVCLYESDEALTMTAEVPGLNADAVNVTVVNDTLTVEAELRRPAPEGYKLHRQERRQGRILRSFTLPYAVDPERTTAKVVNGILEVNLPKAAQAQRRAITVRAE